jgi:hypothetical protein
MRVLVIIATIAILVICFKYRNLSQENARLKGELVHCRQVFGSLLEVANEIAGSIGAEVMVGRNNAGTTIILKKKTTAESQQQPTPDTEESHATH